MDLRKIVYYGFGAFIGFVCGILISLIFYGVEKSGHPILTELGRHHGVWGRALAESVNGLPFFGIAFGMVIVKILFDGKLNSRDN